MNQVTVLFSGAYMGPERRRESGGQLPTVDNNNVMKASYTMWPEPKPAKNEFPGDASPLPCEPTEAS